MSYIDAGYAAALGVLFLYGISLVVRRRRLERAVYGPAADAGSRDPGPGPVSPDR
jgi:hypothetical protein